MENIQTRPGCRIMFRLPNGEANGMTLFTNKDGEQCLAIVVDDKTYVSKDPFETYEEVTL